MYVLDGVADAVPVAVAGAGGALVGEDMVGPWTARP